jgi:branched-chain amino acid transport system permease protein
MLVTILDVGIAGLLMGGLYALIIMLGALATWSLHTVLGISPLLSLVVCAPAGFILGYILHRTLYKRLMVTSDSPGIFEGNSMLASFGLLFIIQNLAYLIWGTRYKAYSYLAVPVNLGGALFPANSLVTLGFSLLIGVVFYIFLVRTRMGKAIRAAAQDSSTAGLMGVNINFVLALCFGLGVAMAACAGMLISMNYSVFPSMGMEYTVIAIIVVVLGGLGSIPGSFIGGIILGVIGSIVTYFDAGLALVAYYVIFILLLLLKPTGLMGK